MVVIVDKIIQQETNVLHTVSIFIKESITFLSKLRPIQTLRSPISAEFDT